MSDIPPPTVPVASESRFLFCQMAIESRLQDLLDDAMEAGWGEDELLVSVIELADNLMLAARASENIEQLLRAIRRGR